MLPNLAGLRLTPSAREDERDGQAAAVGMPGGDDKGTKSVYSVLAKKAHSYRGEWPVVPRNAADDSRFRWYPSLMTPAELSRQMVRDHWEDQTKEKLPFDGPFYLFDGANIFFDRTDPDFIQFRNVGLRTALVNQSLARLPVLIIMKHDALPQSKASYDSMLEVLSHFARERESDDVNWNVHMMTVRVAKCVDKDDEQAFQCMRTYKGKRNLCKFHIKDDPLPYTQLAPGDVFPMQGWYSRMISHEHCEYDDVVLSTMFLHMVDDPVNVEVVTNDRLALKNDVLCEEVLENMALLKVANQDGDPKERDEPIVNFITEHWSLKVPISSDDAQSRFVAGLAPAKDAESPLTRHDLTGRERWGVRGGDTPAYDFYTDPRAEEEGEVPALAGDKRGPESPDVPRPSKRQTSFPPAVQLDDESSGLGPETSES